MIDLHEILKYENVFILIEKMGQNNILAKPLWNPPTIFRKYCVGVGEEGIKVVVR